MEGVIEAIKTLRYPTVFCTLVVIEAKSYTAVYKYIVKLDATGSPE